MKLIYTNENRLLVGNVQNILEAHNIEVILKNEYSQGAVGELSVFDSWPELWILMDSDYEKAVKVIKNYKSKESDPEWVCSTCGESNDASFDSCWKCQNENS
ncbi:MAG: DUF2007 domain-containing protein [Gammaproteobacteria bacterium]|nr:DUF2007 domain-containing protein [Gammaproteobacteria bacterium]